MFIVHCLRKKTWEKCKSEKYFGEDSIDFCGFIHCSEPSTFRLVAPNFANEHEDLVLLKIDTDLVEAEIKFEDDGNYGTDYPHIYGLLNTSAIVDVLPCLFNENGDWIAPVGL